MPSRLLFHLAAAVLVCSIVSIVSADTITLTTGEKIEGKITAETDAEVTVDVKVSAGVTDQTTIPKTKIAKIEKEQPDETAWQALKTLKPGANSLPEAQYDVVIRPLQTFVDTYPKSTRAAEASQLLAIFAGEKARVEGGEVRIGEKWLSKDKAAKERYQIGGSLAFQYLRSQRAGGDLIGALNSFEQIEKTYPGSKTFPDAVEAAREALSALKATVERADQLYRVQQAEFEQGAANAAPAQRAELIAARQRELAQGEAAVAAAEKAKIKWPALFPRSEKNLEAIAKKIPDAEKHLASIDISKLKQSSALTEQAQKQIADQNIAAGQSLAKALELWPQNELAKRLQQEAATIKAAPVAETPAVPAATPVPATPRPHPVVAAPPPEPEKPFLLTAGGIITIIVFIALAVAGVLAFRRIKSRANEILE